jgi:hypothetical protein
VGVHGEQRHPGDERRSAEAAGDDGPMVRGGAGLLEVGELVFQRAGGDAVGRGGNPVLASLDGLQPLLADGAYEVASGCLEAGDQLRPGAAARADEGDPADRQGGGDQRRDVAPAAAGEDAEGAAIDVVAVRQGPQRRT